MRRVLVTGMSGTGKSSVVDALAERGHRAVDADYGGLSHLVAVPGDELTGVGAGRDWVWREDRIERLLATDDGDLLFLAGCAPNQGKFYPRFDHVILLTAPAEVIARRLATRTTNPYGRRPDQLARTLELKRTVEPLLRRGADLEIETTLPLDEVVAAILRHVRPSGALPYGGSDSSWSGDHVG
ncbi:AAA family ATPase [Micromonospora sp. NPDC049559]|uniref:AAA family ATPase n=1 Tax=Micromonospora sp. NPDC049559 TaxID=3155923 RepID=UPI003433B9D7